MVETVIELDVCLQFTFEEVKDMEETIKKFREFCRKFQGLSLKREEFISKRYMVD